MTKIIAAAGVIQEYACAAWRLPGGTELNVWRWVDNRWLPGGYAQPPPDSEAGNG